MTTERGRFSVGSDWVLIAQSTLRRDPHTPAFVTRTSPRFAATITPERDRTAESPAPFKEKLRMAQPTGRLSLRT